MNSRVKAQIEGGKYLSEIKQQLVEFAKSGTDLESIDKLAEKLLLKTGGKPSFKTVGDYRWSTCININDGLVHGIPKSTLILKSGDLATIDVGLLYKGYHTDTSTSFIVDGQKDPKIENFLAVGKSTLKKAIAQAVPGNRISDISATIQKGVEAAGFNVVRDLTGHGIGTSLHQDPAVPCLNLSDPSSSPHIKNDQALAIEVMYTMGDWHLKHDPDNWTLSTADGSLSAVFEETIIVTNSTPKVITQIS